MTGSDERSLGQLEVQVAAVLGVDRVRLVAAPAGGSRAAFRVETTDDEHAAFLRLDDGESGMSGTAFDLRREAAILEHVRAAGLPVPKVLGSIDEPQGTVLEYVEGTSRLGPGVADAVGPEYMSWIAAAHRVDPTGAPVERFPTIDAAVRSDLAWWNERAVATGIDATPLVAVARRVLHDTLPAVDTPPQFVHGDVGPGNFMVRDGRIAAVLDWELAHLGDPHEDLAWMWMRGAHSDFGDPQRRLAEYEAAAGGPVDQARLRWHLAFVIHKTVIAIRGRLRQPGSGRLVMTQYVLLTVYEALLASALAHLLGTSVDVLGDEPHDAVTAEVRVVDRLAESLHADDREAQVALEHLRLAATHRPWRMAAHHADCLAELGHEPGVLVAAVPSATAAQLAAMVRVLGRDAGRACWSLPPALRRVRRAQTIGLGT